MYSQLWTCGNCGWATFDYESERKTLGARVEYRETGMMKEICQECVKLLGFAVKYKLRSFIAEPTMKTNNTVNGEELD